MTTDLRELLKEVRDELDATLNVQASPDLKRFIDRIDAALSEPAPEPTIYLCPAGCGCTWRPAVYMEAVKQEMFGLFGPNSKSCEVCESLPLDKLIPLYAAPPPASPLDARDAARLDWAEHHPEAFHTVMNSWWANAGRGHREIQFNWRGAIDDAIEREGGANG